jgi:uncharacterized protein (TIGR02996 family)
MTDDLTGSFMQDILAAPDEDAPRLVYADWLDDHGPPARAELIRVQCALAALARDDPRRGELEKRAWDLRHQCWPILQGERPPGLDLLRPEVYRGFWADITCTMSAWERLAPRAFRVWPIERAWLYNINPAMLPKLLRSKYLPRLRWLKLAPAVVVYDSEAARLVAGCRHLAGLRELEIVGGNVIGDEGARALAESSPLSQLRSLFLVDTAITPEGIGVLRARFGEGVKVRLLEPDRYTAL